MAIINSVIVSGGAPAPSGKYQLLQRVTDDNNDEIGTVCCFHTDANNVEYAVVCLDAQHRITNGVFCSDASNNIPNLEMTTIANGLDSIVTATQNTTAIIDYITANNYTSTAATHCRSKSFVIDGVTYYGQLPTWAEITKMFLYRTSIDSLDPTATQYAACALGGANNTGAWSSTGYGIPSSIGMPPQGFSPYLSKTTPRIIIPILELPNA